MKDVPTFKAEDIGDFHPFADLLLEQEIARLREEIAFQADMIQTLREEKWDERCTVRNVTDARAWLIIYMMHQGNPGDMLDAPRIASILRHTDMPGLRLPDKKVVRQQVLDVIHRIPELDDRFRIELVGHAKKVWRVIRMY